MNIFSDFLNLLSDNYNIFITLLALIILIWGIYNRIKFLCLEKATQMVAKVEDRSELTGEEKFALCIIWINEELPKVFRNSLFKSIVEKLLQFAYENSFEYMKKYVKTKTGHDITELIEQAKDILDNKDNIKTIKEK